MWIHILIACLPLLLLIALGVLGALMKKKCKFQKPDDPFWPYAENQQLALELAGSNQFVDRVIGKAGTSIGDANRAAARKFQQLDRVFIFVYVLFFTAVAYTRTNLSLGLLSVALLAVLTGIFDFIEDQQILRMVAQNPSGSARRFGQTKWFFYFVTMGAEAVLFFFAHSSSIFRYTAEIVFCVALLIVALGGIVFSLLGRFNGISSASSVSVVGLLVLALIPLAALNRGSCASKAQYLVLMRVPVLLGLLLFALPFIAFFTPAKTLLRGLFDLTPLSLFVVTLTTLAGAGTSCVTAWIILNNSGERFNLSHLPIESMVSSAEWLGAMIVLSLPVIVFSIWFSSKQEHSPPRLIVAALTAVILAIGVAWFLQKYGPELIASILPFLTAPSLKLTLANTELFRGYVSANVSQTLPWAAHLEAFAAFLATVILYAVVGFYGRSQLGKKRTVPALCSLLMLILMLGWMLSGMTFFLDAWRIPTLLVIALIVLASAQSSQSDHFYTLKNRTSSSPDAATTITASKQDRVIVVAANGGGIQAGAWAAQVLYGLSQDEESGERFQRALRMISSVSGGSMGNAMFVHWLANKENARPPDEAAAMSSLDEVAWGLAWPDFLRALVPWMFGNLIGRGRALERAWLLNSVPTPETKSRIDDPVSDWNEMVGVGNLPAVVMNATIAETGERLLFGTTHLQARHDGGGALVEAAELLTINDEEHDVAVVTAARLSSTFPYVTPASRAKAEGPQPHVVDGGYYDNYGMATMVEWLDEGLAGADGAIKKVLVVQVHGAPVESDLSAKRHAKSRGWFYQAFAPLTTLAAVRNAGQVAHNDLELELLQQKWSNLGVSIDSVTFQFNNSEAPLSWHLTPTEVKAIKDAWLKDMTDCREVVRKFLR